MTAPEAPEHVTPSADIWADGSMRLASVAAFLDLSRREVDRILERGELPAVQYGRYRLVPRRAVVAMLASLRAPNMYSNSAPL